MRSSRNPCKIGFVAGDALASDRRPQKSNCTVRIDAASQSLDESAGLWSSARPGKVNHVRRRKRDFCPWHTAGKQDRMEVAEPDSGTACDGAAGSKGRGCDVDGARHAERKEFAHPLDDFIATADRTTQNDLAGSGYGANGGDRTSEVSGGFFKNRQCRFVALGSGVKDPGYVHCFARPVSA